MSNLRKYLLDTEKNDIGFSNSLFDTGELSDLIDFNEASISLENHYSALDDLIYTYEGFLKINAIDFSNKTSIAIEVYNILSKRLGLEDIDFSLEEEKRNIFKRIWDAIMETFRKLMDWIKGFFNKSVVVEKALDKNIENVTKEIIETIEIIEEGPNVPLLGLPAPTKSAIQERREKRGKREKGEKGSEKSPLALSSPRDLEFEYDFSKSFCKELNFDVLGLKDFIDSATDCIWNLNDEYSTPYGMIHTLSSFLKKVDVDVKQSDIDQLKKDLNKEAYDDVVDFNIRNKGVEVLKSGTYIPPEIKKQSGISIEKGEALMYNKALYKISNKFSYSENYCILSDMSLETQLNKRMEIVKFSDVKNLIHKTEFQSKYYPTKGQLRYYIEDPLKKSSSSMKLFESSVSKLDKYIEEFRLKIKEGINGETGEMFKAIENISLNVIKISNKHTFGKLMAQVVKTHIDAKSQYLKFTKTCLNHYSKTYDI